MNTEYKFLISTDTTPFRVGVEHNAKSKIKQNVIQSVAKRNEESSFQYNIDSSCPRNDNKTNPKMEKELSKLYIKLMEDNLKIIRIIINEEKRKNQNMRCFPSENKRVCEKKRN
jgi:hypothetical protein